MTQLLPIVPSTTSMSNNLHFKLFNARSFAVSTTLTNESRSLEVIKLHIFVQYANYFESMKAPSTCQLGVGSTADCPATEESEQKMDFDVLSAE